MKMIKTEFNEKDWELAFERSALYEIRIAIVKWHKDGSRDVIMKDGTINHVPKDCQIDNCGGPTVILKFPMERPK